MVNPRGVILGEGITSASPLVSTIAVSERKPKGRKNVELSLKVKKSVKEKSSSTRE